MQTKKEIIKICVDIKNQNGGVFLYAEYVPVENNPEDTFKNHIQDLKNKYPKRTFEHPHYQTKVEPSTQNGFRFWERARMEELDDPNGINGRNI